MKNQIFIMAAYLGFIASSVGADKQKKPAEQSNTFNYKSRVYSCNIDSFGIIRNVKCGKDIVIKKEQVCGTYKAAEGEDSRFFQSTCEGEPIQVQKKPNNCFTITKKGVFKNKTFIKGAEFKKVIELTPYNMNFKVEVTTSVPLATQQNVFHNILTLPVAVYGDKKGKLSYTGAEDKVIDITLPMTFVQDQAINKQKLGKVIFSLPSVFFCIKTGPQTSIALMDTRAWGEEKNFRLDIGKQLPWHQEATTFPSGTELAWEFSINFRKK